MYYAHKCNSDGVLITSASQFCHSGFKFLLWSSCLAFGFIPCVCMRILHTFPKNMFLRFIDDHHSHHRSECKHEWWFVFMCPSFGLPPSQGVPSITPKFSRDRIQLGRDPKEDKRFVKWTMDVYYPDTQVHTHTHAYTQASANSIRSDTDLLSERVTPMSIDSQRAA